MLETTKAIRMCHRTKKKKLFCYMNDTGAKELAENELGFEEAMNRLEDLVESMESGSAPLVELVDRYEEGAKLLKDCRKRLEIAELKIKEVREKDGQMVAEPIEQESNE